MAVVHVTAESFETEVLKAEMPVMVDFFAQWCGPCKSMSPIVEELSEELTDMKICKLDVDDAMDIARKYHIMSIPAFILFKDGEPVKRTIGGQSKEEILEFLGR